jgi:uncharacterized membrane protein YhdT
MKWKAFFGLLIAYVAGVCTAFYLVVTLPGQPHALEQFLLWTAAGAICVPLVVQNLFDW